MPKLPVGTTYYFAVTAFDQAGNESTKSGEFSKWVIKSCWVFQEWRNRALHSGVPEHAARAGDLATMRRPEGAPWTPERGAQ